MKAFLFGLFLCAVAFGSEIPIYVIVKGKVKEVLVKEGQKVKKGDLLLRIDPILYELEIQRLKAKEEEVSARLWKVERDFRRVEELFNRDLIAESRYEEQKIRYQQQKARVDQVIAQRRKFEVLASYTEIRSPASGKIKKILVREGSYVNGELIPHKVIILEISP